MDRLLYLVARSLIAGIQALPLRLVARLGRGGGLIAYHLDARHRRVARRNIARCFPEKSSAEVGALVKENLRRIGESYASGIKTASMTAEQLRPHLELQVPEHWLNPTSDQPPESLVVAIGHFGNFELYVHLAQYCPAYQGASTYRALPQPSLNRLMQSLREKSGCLFFERRFEGSKLRAAMSQPGMMLGLLSDQDGGDRGLQLRFLGHNCSTSPAVAVLALRYNCVIQSAICYRVGLARWRIECGEVIHTRDGNDQARSTEAIMRDVNAALEQGVRRDPANWFWVHNRWKRGRADAPPQPQAA
jgi:KDO2-lipid IV(A) lauroyltransferase